MQMCCRPARPQTACSPHEVMVLWDVWEDTARRPLTRACCLAQADHIGPSFHFQSVLTRVISCLSDSSRFGNGGTYPNTKPRSMRRSATPRLPPPPPWASLTSSLASLEDECKDPPLREGGAMVASSCCPNSSSTVLVSIW